MEGIVGTAMALPSLDIRQFRAFRHLEIERLGRVNLITGKNNVGKTCLLEALWLYASRGSPSRVFQLLEWRDEIGYSSVQSALDGTPDNERAVRYLYHGRAELLAIQEPIAIGPRRSPSRRLTVAIEWAAFSPAEPDRRELEILDPDEYDTAENPVLVLVVQLGTRAPTIHRLDGYFDRRGFRLPWKPLADEIPCSFLTADGLDAQEFSHMWDTVALTDMEEEVLGALSIIEPDVRRVNLVGDARSSRGRIPILRLGSLPDPVPLQSMGEGMNRLFGITLAMVNAKDGILLIDEVESGLHYSVHHQMWEQIIEVASQLNVQVFATTHSWDCIEAFQQAVQDAHDQEGLLVSLREKRREPGHVVSVLFDEAELAVAAREDIEIR